MQNGGHIRAKYVTKTCLFKNKTSKKITNNLAIHIRSTLPCSGLIRIYSEPSKQTEQTVFDRTNGIQTRSVCMTFLRPLKKTVHDTDITNNVQGIVHPKVIFFPFSTHP